MKFEMDTTQTDSKPLSAKDARAPMDSKPLSAEGARAPAASKPKPFAAPITESTSEHAAVTSVAPAPSEAKKGETQSGEKRDLDSVSAAPAPAVENKPVAEKSEEQTEQRDAKKQKKQEEPSKNTNGTSAHTATASDAKGKPTKISRSKKDKAKDAVKKAIPTDGIGSRTRSHTKVT